MNSRIFEKWRDTYEKMSYQDQINFYNMAEARWPIQKHYNIKDIKIVFDLIDKPVKVLEFGGWKGDLANDIISIYGDGIISWKNIELCKRAIERTVCLSNKYSVIFPDKFDWFAEKRMENADIIIATHFIEHLSDKHFEGLVKYCKGIKNIYFEAPLKIEDGNNWVGYKGAHKLSYGWNTLIGLMKDNGYLVFKSFRNSKLFLYE